MRLAVLVMVVICAVNLFAVASSAEPIVIEHLLKSSPTTDSAFKLAADLFNSIQDEVQVKFSLGSNSPTAYNNSILVRAAAGAPPDVLSSNWLGEVAGNNLALPLNSFIERNGLNKKFIPDVLRLNSWEGDLIQLPLWVQPLVTYYNDAMFAEAGLQNPKAAYKSGTWNWDTIADATKRMNKDSNSDGVADKWGFGLGGYTITRSVLWVRQAGGYFFDATVNPHASRMNTPQMRTALQYLWKLIDERGLPVDAIATGAAYTNFAKQTVGILFDGPWLIGANRHWTDWNLAPVPRGPANSETAIQIDGVQIARGSKHPEAAWKWLNFLVTDPRAVVILTQETGRPPAVLTQLAHYEQLAAVNGHPDTKVVANALMQNSFYPLMPMSVHWSKLETAYSKEMVSFYRKQQSLETVIERLDTQFTQILSGK